MHPPNPSAGAGSIPAFLVRTAQSQYLAEANQAARDLLGMAAAAPSPVAEVIASLTGRSFVEEIADLTQSASAKTIPALLLGTGLSVIPAMLECRRKDNDIHVLAVETGNREILQRGGVDATAMLRAAIEVSPGSIITVDELGSVLSFNRAAEAAFGYTAEEVIGQNVAMLMQPDDAAVHDEHLRRYLHTGERRIIGSMRVLEARRKNGETFPVELYVGEVRSGDRRLYAGFLRDISHRRELQAETVTLQRELIHVTRLASMGEMAAALAHELNQPLTAIAAFAEAARLQLQPLGENAPLPAQENLAKVAAQAVRAGEVIRRMRQLAIGGAGQRDPEDLNAIVREAMTLATIGAKALGIETSVVEANHIPPVICDRIQVQQVIINLVRNAIDAFEEAPPAPPAASGPRRITIETQADRRQARVSVHDTGPGVPGDIAGQLFDSFLTTKALGVGLGLPVSRMIIESHGGKLWYETHAGGGALFRFTLPLQEGDLEP
jgi:two-component system sensor kinase FixL